MKDRNCGGETYNKRRGIISGIDLWQFLYIAVIALFSYLLHDSPIVSFAILAIMALPFYKHVEHFIAILFLVAPIAYFFSSSDEGVLSLYTVAILLLMARSLPQISFLKSKAFVIRLIFIGVLFASFFVSEFDSKRGLLGLLYIIVVSLFLSSIKGFDINNFTSAIIKGSCFMLFVYMVIIFSTSPVMSISDKLTISATVNSNTTGFAISQLTVTIASAYLLLNKRTKSTLIFFIFSVLTLIVIGSTNALLAAVLTILTVSLIDAHRKGKAGKRMIALAIVAALSIVTLDIFVGDIIFAKYNIAYIIESGGTNRVNVWSKIIPYVYNEYRWLGYGPSKGITTTVLQSLVGRSYSHAHNSLVEVFCETGLIGLSVFIILLVVTFKNVIEASRKNENNYIVLALLFGVFFAGLGESYFNDIVLWLIIGISNRCDLTKTEGVYE